MAKFVVVKSDGGDDLRVIFRGTEEECKEFIYNSWRIGVRKYTTDGEASDETHDNAIDTMASYDEAAGDAWEDAGTGEVRSILPLTRAKNLPVALEPMPVPPAPIPGSLGALVE